MADNTQNTAIGRKSEGQSTRGRFQSRVTSTWHHISQHAHPDLPHKVSPKRAWPACRRAHQTGS
eukprot:425900-Amphidinium_carterae.1